MDDKTKENENDQNNANDDGEVQQQQQQQQTKTQSADYRPNWYGICFLGCLLVFLVIGFILIIAALTSNDIKRLTYTSASNNVVEIRIGFFKTTVSQNGNHIYTDTLDRDCYAADSGVQLYEGSDCATLNAGRAFGVILAVLQGLIFLTGFIAVFDYWWFRESAQPDRAGRETVMFVLPLGCLNLLGMIAGFICVLCMGCLPYDDYMQPPFTNGSESSAFGAAGAELVVGYIFCTWPLCGPIVAYIHNRNFRVIYA